MRVQSGNEKGRVYPPLLIIEYGELTSESIQKNDMVQLHFKVSFEMDSNMTHAIEVSNPVIALCFFFIYLY